MPSLTSRRGTGLAELFVALALGGVLMSAAARGLVLQMRQRADREAQGRADDVVRGVRDVLRAELAHASGEVRVLGDTALQLASLRVVAVACDLTAPRVVVPTQEWWSAPRAGDSLAVRDTLTGVEWRTTVVAVATQRASAACPTGGQRLTLASVPPASVPMLRLPLRVWRTVRFVTYRASDGSWWLGERSCAPGCGAPQPIAGPLLPSAQGGMQLRAVLDAAGRTWACDLTVRAAVGARTATVSARLPLAEAP